MLRKIDNLKILQNGYQRNGVGGEGFYFFKISWTDDNKQKREGVATLTVAGDAINEHPEKFNGSCRVITPDNLEDHWRGDVFEYEIRLLYKQWF